MRRPSNEFKKISKSILTVLFCCIFLGGCTSAVPVTKGEEPIGADTIESDIQSVVPPEIPTEVIYKVSYQNGGELPVSWGTLYLTGDDSDSYNLFHAEILTGGDLSDPLAAMADTQYFGITAYIPVSDCTAGLICEDDYFISSGAIYFNYNNPDIDSIPELLTIDNVTFVLYEYSPESHAIFSLTADITVEDISYTFEGAGPAAYLTEGSMDET